MGDGLMIAGAVILTIGLVILVTGEVGYGIVRPLDYVALVLVIVGFGSGIFGVVLAAQQADEKIKEELTEKAEKWEQLADEVKGTVVERTGVFDVEIISRNGKENYYNVRSGEELYRVYYKEFRVIGIEQNDKFLYAGEKKMEEGKGPE